MDRTTINIKKEVREALKKIRRYPRETYDETLERVVNQELKKHLKKKIKF